MNPSLLSPLGGLFFWLLFENGCGAPTTPSHWLQCAEQPTGKHWPASGTQTAGSHMLQRPEKPPVKHRAVYWAPNDDLAGKWQEIQKFARNYKTLSMMF